MDQSDLDGDGIGDACDCGDFLVSFEEECDEGGEGDTPSCNADCTLPAYHIH